MMIIAPADRPTALSLAAQDSLYPTLVQDINTALAEQPFSLLDFNVFPNIYKEAWKMAIAIDTLQTPGIQAGTVAHANQRRAIPNTAPPVTVGTSSAPYLSGSTGGTIGLVNPTMIFYGYNFSGTQSVMEAKDSLWKLQFGWPPTVWTDPTVTNVSEPDGNYNVIFTKGDLTTTAGQVALSANVLTASCKVLDVIFYCPASNDTVQAL